MEANLKHGPTQGKEAPLEPTSQPVMVPVSSLQAHSLSLAIYGDEPVDPELVASIAGCGVLEPLAVLADGTIVSGHRRWRAAQAAGLSSVPVTVVRFASTLVMLR